MADGENPEEGGKLHSEANDYMDILRYVYGIMAFVLLVSTAFLKYHLPFPAYFSFLIIVVLIIMAGLTIPGVRKVMLLDFFVALGVFVIFGWQVFVSYNSPSTGFFWVSLLISLLSLVAMYISTRTLRYDVYKLIE